MKISFRSDPPFPSTVLSDKSLGASGITEHHSPHVDNKEERCLVEGENRLWAKVTPKGNVMFLECDDGHDPRKILEKLGALSGSEIVSQFDSEYWGVETPEELGHCDRYASHYREELYRELLRYALEHPVRVELEELARQKAGIAKDLIAKDPSLAFKLDVLLERFDQEYRGRGTKVICHQPD
jgi:hypothetical protein